jgi:hypothetical protein
MRAVSNLVMVTGLVAVALQTLETSLWPLGVLLLGGIGWISRTSLRR